MTEKIDNKIHFFQLGTRASAFNCSITTILNYFYPGSGTVGSISPLISNTLGSSDGNFELIGELELIFTWQLSLHL